MRPLPRDFYDRATQLVARDLLGMHLTHRVGDLQRVGRIVETEAYLGPHDLAAHWCAAGLLRTEVMFGPPGFAYVYLIYGVHHCMNVVTEAEGHASAVLILRSSRSEMSRAARRGRACSAGAGDRSAA